MEQLARRAQGGDPRAFDRLASAVSPRVRRWALAHVDSADDAEDVLQEVLLKIHRALPNFSFGSRFSTWIYTVTRSAAADWHRKRHRRATLFAAHAQALPHSEQPGLSLDQSRPSAAVRQAFRRLPNRQREVFDLADLQGLPLTEIAEMLNLNATTTRVHLHRARAAIRAQVLGTEPALVEDRK